MLDSFRTASKSWVVKLLFGLLVFSFVAWGVGDVVRGGLFGHGPAIEIGSTQVSAAEVMAEFKREVDLLQPQFGGKLTSADARKLGLLDRTIEGIVNRTLIDESARSLGLSASDEAVVARVAAEPAFRNELGQFDREVLRRALGRVGLSEAEFLRQEKGNLIRSQMADALSGGMAAPLTMAEPLVRWRQETRVAETALIKAASLPDQAAPEAAALEQYYKDNSASFMAPEFRAVSALMLRGDALAKDIAITDEMIAESYKSRADEFHAPERRAVSQVVLPDQAGADRAALMVKAGRDLKAVAKESGVGIVDLGLIENGDLPSELSEAIFAAPSGAMLGPIKSALGWHVVQVGEVIAEHTSPLAEVKDLLAKDLAHDKAADRLSEVANQVEDALGGGATLEEVATKFGLPLLRVAAVDPQGRGPNGKPVADLPKDDSFLDVAFHTEQGTESQMSEIDNNGLFLLRVDSVTPPQPRPLADVRAEVLASWQAEKRQQAAQAKAQAVVERVKAGDTFAKAAQAAGLKVEITKPFTREGADQARLPGELVANLFKAKPGDATSAATRDGWIVAGLTQVVAFDPKTNPKLVDQQRASLAAAIGADLIDQYIAALGTEMGVKIDRSQVAREE